MFDTIVNKGFKIIYLLYIITSTILFFVFSATDNDLGAAIAQVEIPVITLVITILFFALRSASKTAALIVKALLIVIMVLLPFYYYLA